MENIFYEDYKKQMYMLIKKCKLGGSFASILTGKTASQVASPEFGKISHYNRNMFCKALFVFINKNIAIIFFISDLFLPKRPK